MAAAEASTASRVGEAGTIMGETGRAGTSRGGDLPGRSTGGTGRIGAGRGQRHGVAHGRRQRRSAEHTVPPEFAGGRVQPRRRTTAANAAKPDSNQPSGDRRYCAASVTSPHGCQMTWKSARWLDHGRLPRIRADAQPHDASNDSQMILSFTEHPLTVACLGQLGTNQPARGLPSPASCRPQRQEQHRSGASSSRCLMRRRDS